MAFVEFIQGAMGFIMIALASTTPILLAAMAGLISERSGIVNIALEGKMLFGALCAVIVTSWTGSPLLGLAAAIVGGVLLAMLHFFNCQFLDAEHVVSGAAINILSIGLTGFLVFQIFQSKSSTQVAVLPALEFSKLDIPVIGPVLDLFLTGMPILFLLGIFVVFIIQYVLNKTPFGLHVRACGENPLIAEARGISVVRTRVICLLVSGLLAGLAGAQLALGDIGFFTEKMSSGRGFIALAAVIFGRWRPVPVLAATLFFGFADAFALRMKLHWQVVPDELALAIPFVLTIIVLVLARGASGMPTSLGKKSTDLHLN